MGAALNGPLLSSAGPVVYTGQGRFGDLIVISRNGASVGSGFVASDGTFALNLAGSLAAGDLVQAHAGSLTGPSNNVVSVSAGVASPGAPMSGTISAGATIITVTGNPGDTVVIVADPDGAGPLPPQALGTAVVPASGQVGVTLSQALSPGETFNVVVGGASGPAVTASASALPPPVVNVGVVLDGNSTVTGTGVAGATVQAVDSQGHVLGTTTVDNQGHFSLTISGATPGQSVSIVENGVRATTSLPSYTLGVEKAFTSANVFNPDKGVPVSIGFRAEGDGRVTVKVYSIAGELVRPVFETDAKAGQQFQADWDGKNADGDTVASGVYFVSVRGAGIKSIRKVIVLK